MTFGEIIKKSRENRKLSQESLARILKKEYGVNNISASYISMIETNTRTNITVKLMSALLNCFNLPLEAASSFFTCPLRYAEYAVENQPGAVRETQIKYSATSTEAPFEEYDKLPAEAQNLLKEYYSFLIVKYANDKRPL